MFAWRFLHHRRDPLSLVLKNNQWLIPVPPGSSRPPSSLHRCFAVPPLKKYPKSPPPFVPGMHSQLPYTYWGPGSGMGTGVSRSHRLTAAQNMKEARALQGIKASCLSFQRMRNSCLLSPLKKKKKYTKSFPCGGKAWNRFIFNVFYLISREDQERRNLAINTPANGDK